MLIFTMWLCRKVCPADKMTEADTMGFAVVVEVVAYL